MTLALPQPFWTLAMSARGRGHWCGGGTGRMGPNLVPLSLASSVHLDDLINAVDSQRGVDAANGGLLRTGGIGEADGTFPWPEACR